MNIFLRNITIVSFLASVVSVSSFGQSKAKTTLAGNPASAQDSVPTNPDSSRLADIKKYYALALQYKNGTGGVEQDFAEAYSYFSQAAALDDAQSAYAVAYMKYKGLGTAQDYAAAAKLFAQGAYLGRDNSEYFLALCYRNGYGVEQNEDSAQYWLKKSAALGYKQAVQELRMETSENGNNAAKQLVQRIHNAAIPDKVVLNEFVPVKPTLPDADVIEGEYEGYVIQYDWSGKHPVSTKPLLLVLNKTDNSINAVASSSGSLSQANVAAANDSNSGSTVSAGNNNKSAQGLSFSGRWQEEGVDTVNINAAFLGDSLVFDTTTHYGRKDHYSPSKAVRYDFKNAGLNIVRKGDSVYIAGTVNMFSPDRKEPSKPLFVALTRITADGSLIKSQQGNQNLHDSSAAVKLLSVYPNPFTSYVNVQFMVSKSGNVGIELYNMAGQRVYTKQPQSLNQGQYSIRVEPSSTIPQQTYLLKLVFQNGQETIKVIKI